VNQKKVLEIQQSIEGAKLELVTATRRYVKEGFVTNEKGEDWILFLFNDLVLIVKQKSKGIGKLLGGEEKQTFDLKANVPLEDGRVADLAESNLQNAFQVLLGKKAWTLCCENPQEKANWLKDNRQVKGDMLKNQVDKENKRKTMVLGPSGGARSSGSFEPPP